MQSTSNDIDQNQTVEQPSSRPESADGGADAGDVEAVLLKRFVTETIKHLGPLVFAQLHHHHASVSSPPVENLGNGEHKLSIPIPTVLSNEVSAAATPGTPPPLKIPPVSNGPLSDTLSVTVATPQLSPRSDLLACPTILSVQTITTTAGGSRSAAALLSNVVDTFCRALATAAEDSCEQYQLTTSQNDGINANGTFTPKPVITPISHFFAVALPKVATKLQQQMSAMTPRGGTAGFSPRPVESRGSFFAGGGHLWDNFQSIGSNAQHSERQGSLDQMGDEDAGVSSWLQETYSTVGVSKRLGQGRSSVGGPMASKRSVTRMSGFPAMTKATASEEPLVLDKTAKEQSLSATPFRKQMNLDTPIDDGVVPQKKVRGLSVGFKEEEVAAAAAAVVPNQEPSLSRRSSNNSTNSPKDDDNLGNNSTSTEHDPFANVAPLTPNVDSPLGPKKTLSRKGSQYFRRQSVTPSVSGGESPAVGTAFNVAQSLNPTDLIKIRLDSLSVPWLDVDNVDFDIFDTCDKIDRGELTLQSSNSIHGVSLSSNQNNNEPVVLSSQHVFRYICVNVMLRYSFIDALKIDLKKLYAFLAAVETLYNPENPYHNAVHAADVLQTSHIYLLTNNVYENFFDREILCLLLSALVHDVGHLGVNNQFLVKTHHPLAVLYNGLSPLENMHSLLAFRLLEQEDLNFLQGSDVWSSEDWEDLEAKVVEMVIATDMKFHSNAVSIAMDLFKEGFSVEDGDIDKLIKLIIHAADLSNPMKPRFVYQQWAERVISEFFSQGAAEEERGLPISPNFNRELMKFPEMQVGFINFVVKPYANAMSPILPPEWLERLQSNLEFMQANFGKPYERRDVILDFCKDPWVDRWTRVAPIIFNSSATNGLFVSSPSKSEMSASVITPSPSATLTALKSSSDTASSLITTAAAPAVTSAPLTPVVGPAASSPSSVPPLARPGSSVSMAPVVSLLTDAQIRFCMNAYDSTHLLIQKATQAHSENRLGDKLALTDHQRGFAVAIVKLLVKAYEQISSTRKCFGGRAAALVHRVLEEIYGLLVPVVQRSPMAADVQLALQNQDGTVDGDIFDREIIQMRRLLREPNACLKLFKTIWATGFATNGHAFEMTTRLPPLSPKERDVYRETVRQCVSTYVCVLDELVRGGTSNLSTPASQHQFFTHRNVIGALGMPPPTPPLLVDNRGRGLYASAAIAFGTTAALAGISRAASVEPTSDNIVVVPPSGRFSAPLVSAPLAAISKHSASSRASSDDPTPIPSPYITDHRKTLPPLPFIDRGTPEPQISGSTSPQRNSSRIPLVTLEPIDGYTNQLEAYGHPASDDDFDRDDDDAPDSDGEEPPVQGLKQLEKQAQLHFQQSDEQWRMTQTDDGSPRSLGLASMGSFSNSKHLRAVVPLAAIGKQQQDDGPPEMGNSASSHSGQQRQPEMAAVSITAGIPNAYFLPPGSPHSIGHGLRPQSPPTAHGSPNSGYLNVSYSHHPSALGASMDALSFIPMVHSVDPSPRSRIGAQSSPPPGMSLEFMTHMVPPSAQSHLINALGARQSPPPETVNVVDAHNLLQLELLLLHHTTHSAAVRGNNNNNTAGPSDGRRHHSPLSTDHLSTANHAGSDPSNHSSSSGQHTRSSAASTSRSDHPHSRGGAGSGQSSSSPVPDGSPRAHRSMSPENAMKLVEDCDLPLRTTSMQSITDHLQRAAASLTETSLPLVVPQEGSLSIATVFSSPPPAALSHSPKRRSGRKRDQVGAESPLNSPAYRQQLAEMVVNGMESRTFGDSTTGGGSRGVTPSLAAASSSAMLPALTPVQQHSIDEGCLVPEVYRASAAGSFRNPSAHGSFRNNGSTSGHVANLAR